MNGELPRITPGSRRTVKDGIYWMWPGPYGDVLIGAGKRIRGICCPQRGQTLAQMALSGILRDGIVTSVLAGVSKPEQVLDNNKAAQNTIFTADELALIDQLSLVKG